MLGGGPANRRETRQAEVTDATRTGNRPTRVADFANRCPRIVGSVRGFGEDGSRGEHVPRLTTGNWAPEARFKVLEKALERQGLTIGTSTTSAVPAALWMNRRV